MNQLIFRNKKLNKFIASKIVLLLIVFVLFSTRTAHAAAITISSATGEDVISTGVNDRYSIIVSSGYSMYLCEFSASIAPFVDHSNPSWTQDMWDYFNSVGHQSSNTCAVNVNVNHVADEVKLAGIGVSNYASETTYTGYYSAPTNNQNPMSFTVPNVAGSAVVIMLTISGSNSGYVNPTTWSFSPSLSCSTAWQGQFIGNSDLEYVYILTCTNAPAGTYSFTVSAPGIGIDTDPVSVSMAAYVFQGNPAPPPPPPVSVSLSASPSSIQLPQSSTITATIPSPGGPSGTAPYSYTITYTDPSGTSHSLCSTSTSSQSFSCTFSTSAITPTGTYTFRVSVTDKNGKTASASTTLAVNPPPALVASASTSPSQIVVGASSTISGSASGGIPASSGNAYSFVWYACYAASGSCTPTASGASTLTSSGEFTCTYSSSSTSCTFSTPSSGSAGNYYFQVLATDSESPAKTSSSGIAQVTVNPQLAVSISSDSSFVVETKNKATISSVVSGGVPASSGPPYTYTWKELQPATTGNPNPVWQLASDCSGGYSATTCVFSPGSGIPTGDYQFQLFVSDSASPVDNAQSNIVTVTVNPYLSGCGFLPIDIAQNIYTQAPWYCPINEAIYNQWKPMLPFVLIAVILSYAIASLFIMIGIAFRSERIKNFGIGEVYEAIATTLMVLFFVYISAVVFGIIPSLVVGTINPYTTSYNLMLGTIDTAKVLYTNIFNVYVYTKFITSISTKVIITGLPIPAQSLLNPVYAILTITILDPSLAISAFLSDGIAILYAQFYILIFFAVAAIPAFLIPGVIFRSIFPTRALGGALMALAIGFYLVMPTLFAVVYYFTAPNIQHQLVIASSKISRYDANPALAISQVSSTSDLAQALAQVQTAMSSFWLLILFYPSLITAVTYAFVSQVATFLGGATATRALSRMRGFI